VATAGRETIEINRQSAKTLLRPEERGAQGSAAYSTCWIGLRYDGEEIPDHDSAIELPKLLTQFRPHLLARRQAMHMDHLATCIDTDPDRVSTQRRQTVDDLIGSRLQNAGP